MILNLAQKKKADKTVTEATEKDAIYILLNTNDKAIREVYKLEK